MNGLSQSTFVQKDSLRGRIKLLTIDGNNYTIDIDFLTGVYQPNNTKITHSMCKNLEPFVGSETILEFTGMATYCLLEDFQLSLLEFKVDHFEALADVSVDDWIEAFIGFGPSGWQEMKDPYQYLKDERSSH